MHNQRGFSLFSIVFLVMFVILALAYGRSFFDIPYTGYKVGSILASSIRDGNTKESEIKKVFDERVQFEKISDIVSSKNLTVTSGPSGVNATAEYEHCSELWKNWTVCARMSIAR